MKKEKEGKEKLPDLWEILERAYARAAYGKGDERHARGKKFKDQPLMVIPKLLGSSQGQLYQAMKKIQESVGLAHPANVNELLDSIVYLAAAIISTEEQ